MGPSATATMGPMDVLGLDRRRLGTGLLAFGIVGLVLTGLLTVGLTAGAVTAASLDSRLAALTEDISGSLDRASEAMGDAVQVTERTRAALGSGSAAVRGSAGTLDTLAATTDDLAGALDFTILGQQPLAGVAATFATFSTDLERTSAELDALSADLTELDASLGPIGDDLRALQRRFDDLAARLDSGDAFGGVATGLTLVLVLLAAAAIWLLVLAGGITWLGWRLRRANGDHSDVDPRTASRGARPDAA